MTTYQILSLLGIGGLLSGMWLKAVQFMGQLKKENKAQQLGIQALLRAQMISEYNHWSDKGFAPIWARQNFENLWVQYEALGENGVMNDIHQKFLALPTKDKEVHNEQRRYY